MIRRWLDSQYSIVSGLPTPLDTLPSFVGPAADQNGDRNVKRYSYKAINRKRRPYVRI